jgi:DMSO/TMAO reductase YedYZ molybdopterin-dependent catalytic subunit
MKLQPEELLSRREALKLLGLSAGAWFLAACSGQAETTPAPLQSHPTTPADTLTPAASATAEPQIISLTDLPQGFTANRLTPIEDFYVQTIDNVASPDPIEYQLAVSGLVDTPLILGLVDIKNRPRVEQLHTLECISNPVGGNIIGNTSWVGISMRDLLMDAGLQPEARFLHFLSADDYETSIPIDLALDERSMLAYRMGGEDLNIAHGFPVRVLLPGVYGQKQPKWVIGMHVAKSDKLGSWEKQGWSNEATIQINASFETPRLQQYITANTPFYLTGWAMSDSSGIAYVEVSIDDGETWHEASLLRGDDTNVWTLWHWVWEDPQPGTHNLLARATDGNGNQQSNSGVPGLLNNVFPNGSSLMHRITVNVVSA